MEILLLAMVLGLIPAAIARSKGRSFFGFWFYGTLLFIVALPHAILAKPDATGLETQRLAGGAHRKCPYCAELIKKEAVVCRYCGRDLDQRDKPVADAMKIGEDGRWHVS